MDYKPRHVIQFTLAIHNTQADMTIVAGRVVYRETKP